MTSRDSTVRRDNWRGMMKQGKYRALRNLPIGWLLQILHSTDKTERWLRIITEVVLVFALASGLLAVDLIGGWASGLIVSGVVIHTLSWLLIGNFWVYMLDSFLWVKNPGISKVLDYVNLCRDVFVATKSCDAIMIYGSMSRNSFHGRSDLDLRVLRRSGVLNAVKAVYAAMYIKTVAFFRVVPVDLQVVDSMQFLKRQMREDELPIVVYSRVDGIIHNPGHQYKDILRNPSIVLRGD